MGGWELVYTFNGATPLKTWVNAGALDYDTDQDTIEDQREKVYGYNPQAASTLNVLAIHSEVEAVAGNVTFPRPYATLNSQIQYTAVISNELNNRVARGLLQAEFPTGQVRSTEELGVLLPLDTVTMSGSQNISGSGAGAGDTTGMTLRAGAIIDELDERVLWLRMNEQVGATSFNDSSSNNVQFGCKPDGHCPTANGQYLVFDGKGTSSAQLETGHQPKLDLDSFSIGAMVKIDQVGDTPSIYQNGTDFSLYLTNDSEIGFLVEGSLFSTGVSITAQRWHHIMLTYDRESTDTSIYLNGNLIWTLTTSKAINYTSPNEVLKIGGPPSSDERPFYMDELEMFPRVLNGDEIKNRYGGPVVKLDMETLSDTSPAENMVDCSGDRCPTGSASGATFDQSQYLKLVGSEIDFSGDAFTISTWIKPESRAHPFDTRAVNAFNNLDGVAPFDETSDWQGVFGATNTSNNKIIAPTLYINNDGRMRMHMGGGSNTCFVDTAAGLINFDSWQHLTISYNGSVFTFYINGREAAVSTSACAAISPPSHNNLQKFQVGRANDIAVLYMHDISFTNTGDGDGSDNQELRINLNSDGTGGNIWQYNGITPSQPSQTTDFAYRVHGDGSQWFRLYDDDFGSDTSYDPRNCGNICSHDDNFGQRFFNNYAPGNFSNTFSTNQGGADTPAGSYNWSVSNHFFQGSLNEFQVYLRTFSAEQAADLYAASYNGLYFPFDEPPGTEAFVNSYDDNVRAVCDYDNGGCADSGLGGISNQAARFDGSDDILEIEGTDILEDLAVNFTIAAWIKPDNLGGVQRILSAGRQHSAGNGFGFGLLNDNLRLTTFGRYDFDSSSSPIVPGVWQHVAVVFEYLQSAQIYRYLFFVNGQFVEGADGDLANAVAAPNHDDPYRIGSTTVQGGAAIMEQFDGLIDDLIVANRAMSPAEIQELVDNAPVLNLHLDEDLHTNSFTNEGLSQNPAQCVSSVCPGSGDKGQMREALTFDGSNDFIYVPDSDELDLEQFTVALWVNPSHIKSDWQPLITKEGMDTTHRNYALHIKLNTMLAHVSLTAANCTTFIGLDSSTPLQQNQWNHVVGTFDGEQLAIYINGDAKGTKTFTGTPCLSDNQITIGSQTSQSRHFSGKLDEVTILPRALGGTEIKQLFDYQSAWFDVKETHIIKIDADLPRVSLDRAFQFIGPRNTTMKISANDPTSEVVEVSYRIDNGQLRQANNDNGNWIFTWDVLSPGSHDLFLAAKDSVGNAISTNASVTVDNQAPAISFLATPSLILDNEQLYMSATIFDGPTGSGAAKQSVTFTLIDDLGNLVAQIPGVLDDSPTGFQCLGVFCHWQATFPITETYYGNYEVIVTAQDNVGNTVTSSPKPFILDTVGPHADVMVLAGATIPPGTVLQGVASDIDHIWDARTLHLHFEEEVYTTIYADPSQNEFYATCDSRGEPTDDPLPPELMAQCPSAGWAGRYGNTVLFDGVDDRLLITHGETEDVQVTRQLGLTGGGFTVMAWVNGSDWTGDHAVLGVDSVVQNEGLLLGLRDGRPILSFVENDSISDITLPTDEWHHIAWRYNADTGEQAIFVDGLLNKAEEGHAPFAGTDETVYVGRSAGSDVFKGLLDELVIYPFPLPEDRIYDIAHPVPAGIVDVQIRFRELDEEGNEIGVSDWYHVDLMQTADVFTKWTFTMPDDILAGIYKIDSMSTDAFGTTGLAGLDSIEGYRENERVAHNVWTGYVAHHRPRRVMFFPVLMVN